MWRGWGARRVWSSKISYQHGHGGAGGKQVGSTARTRPRLLMLERIQSAREHRRSFHQLLQHARTFEKLLEGSTRHPTLHLTEV